MRYYLDRVRLYFEQFVAVEKDVIDGGVAVAVLGAATAPSPVLPHVQLNITTVEEGIYLRKR
jgi:hypothetical protein